jgi:hypothetical protein
MTRSGLQVRRFSLIELLLITAVSLILAGAMIRTFRLAMQMTGHAHERVTAAEQVSVVKRHWRQAVSATDRAGWRTDAAHFRTGTLRVSRQGDVLVFRTAARRRTVPLPRGTTAAFAVEQNSRSGPVAVLTLSWPDPNRVRSEPTVVRIVAAGGVP